MRNLFLAITTLVLVSRLSAEPELKGSPAELAAYLAGLPKMVSVAGEAELKVPADRAVVSLNVATQHKSLQETLRANQEARAKIISTLKDRGIPSERIQASKFSSTVKTGPFSDKAKGYRVENVLKVKVQDEKEFQAVAHVVDGMSEVQYLGVDFEQSDKEAFKSKALAQALDNASERKRVFEERLGVKLVVKSFSQSGIGQLLGRPQDYEQRRKYSSIGAQGGSAPAITALPAADIAGVAEESGSLFGELVFSARVTVEYAVESK